MPKQTKLEHYLLRQSTESKEFLPKLHTNQAYFEPDNSTTKKEKNFETLIHVKEEYAKGKYEGTKLSGKRHGYGTFYYSEGGKYVGEWA